MRKLIIFILLLVSAGVKAQDSISYESVDSITYNCYLTGNWDQLLETAEQSIAHNIDFKRLRQRMGYAYFVK